MNKKEIEDKFREILSHALLGSDTSDVDKETWDLVVSECANYVETLVENKKELLISFANTYHKKAVEVGRNCKGADWFVDDFLKYGNLPLISHRIGG